MTAISFIISLIVLVWGYSTLWARWTEGQIGLGLHIEEERVTEGEPATLVLTLENRSWLPIPWLELSQDMPKGVAVEVDDEWQDGIVYRTFLLPRQRLHRRYRIKSTRGPHKFDRAEVTYGEGLGLKDLFEFIYSDGTFTVRPRLLNEQELAIPLPELIGEKSILRWYAEDTSRMLGTRSYQMGDPYKHIHWAATARTGQLMVKQFETTSETDFLVLINGQFFNPFWSGTKRKVVDLQCRLAATLFAYAEREGYTYGLYSNASWTGLGGLTVAPDRSPLHFEAMMTALAGLISRASSPFAEHLMGLRGRMKPGSTVVLMTAYWDAEIALAIEHLRGEGHHLVLIAFGDFGTRLNGLSPAVPVIPYQLDAEEDVAELEDDEGAEDDQAKRQQQATRLEAAAAEETQPTEQRGRGA
ncbi:MAG TPA: DUF58 domain-containing protein [Bacilli bacterium]|nr:DUF58 domain-containing protein [Bacilli bacterium]